jgi:hypothetical protein
MTSEERQDKRIEANSVKQNAKIDKHEIRQMWFRRFLITWMIIFTFAVGWMVSDNRERIDEIENNKASIVALQKTNCRTKNFLIAASNARVTANGGYPQLSDIHAARQYTKIITSYGRDSIGDCKELDRLPVPGAP